MKNIQKYIVAGVFIFVGIVQGQQKSKTVVDLWHAQRLAAHRKQHAEMYTMLGTFLATQFHKQQSSDIAATEEQISEAAGKLIAQHIDFLSVLAQEMHNAMHLTIDIVSSQLYSRIIIEEALEKTKKRMDDIYAVKRISGIAFSTEQQERENNFLSWLYQEAERLYTKGAYCCIENEEDDIASVLVKKFIMRYERDYGPIIDPLRESLWFAFHRVACDLFEESNILAEKTAALPEETKKELAKLLPPQSATLTFIIKVLSSNLDEKSKHICFRYANYFAKECWELLDAKATVDSATMQRFNTVRARSVSPQKMEERKEQ